MKYNYCVFDLKSDKRTTGDMGYKKAHDTAMINEMMGRRCGILRVTMISDDDYVNPVYKLNYKEKTWKKA